MAGNTININQICYYLEGLSSMFVYYYFAKNGQFFELIFQCLLNTFEVLLTYKILKYYFVINLIYILKDFIKVIQNNHIIIFTMIL